MHSFLWAYRGDSGTHETLRTPGGVLARILAVRNVPPGFRCPRGADASTGYPRPGGAVDDQAADAALAEVRRQRSKLALRGRAFAPARCNVLIAFRTVEERHHAGHDPLLFTAVEDLEKLFARWRDGSLGKR